MVKNLPAKWEMWVQSWAWKIPLKKEMATYFSIFAWEIPWTEKPGRLQSMGSQKSQTYQVNNNSDNTLLRFLLCVPVISIRNQYPVVLRKPDPVFPLLPLLVE